jgi:DNA modification methylase
LETQLALFSDFENVISDLQISRSGSFIDNMSLPIHRWFRYSAGFSAMWVNDVIENWKIDKGGTILDPFVGSGTVPIVCDALNINSIGIEAHPFVYRICNTKLLWETELEKIISFSDNIIRKSRSVTPDITKYPKLILRSFEESTLETLDKLKIAWTENQDSSPESELIWLAITSILRSTSSAGTAQWQYILPNKSKKNAIDPMFAFIQQIEVFKSDIRWMQKTAKFSRSKIFLDDARTFSNHHTQKVDAVITSPPYANNYDYADALRFEMTFWGDVNNWGDLHEVVRKYLMVSSSQHSSREKISFEELIENEAVKPIKTELVEVMTELAKVRESHGGKKHYHTMIGAYFRDIGLTMHQLRSVCNTGAPMCWVIGDSAPYGVYCPVDRWIGELAIAAGFKNFHFEKLRDRNIKWKNRKHRVPLKEGLLWIEG